MIIESVNNVFGRSLNPYNSERTVGGSSGGEAGIYIFKYKLIYYLY